ncbi:MAG TPA: carbon storage regulator [Gemmataceae bacterium]|nr:carbon storage regulator [Gemmataceae bacterium]
MLLNLWGAFCRRNQEELMLVLARKCGEAIIIPEANVVITILEKHGDRIRVGIEAPPDLMVHRREVWERIQTERGQAPGAGCGSHSPTSAPAVLP